MTSITNYIQHYENFINIDNNYSDQLITVILDFYNENKDDDDISWSIDRSFDYTILNNINSIRNEDFDTQFDNSIQLSVNREINFDYNSDFIPFNVIEPIEIIIDSFSINNDDCDCCICMETKINSDICKLNCNHTFCADCTLENVRRNYTLPSCPLCRTNITTIIVQNEEVYQKFT